MRLLVLTSLLALFACSKSKSDSQKGYVLEDLWIESSSVRFNDHQVWTRGENGVKESREHTAVPDPELAKQCKGKALARENTESADTPDEFTTVTYLCSDEKGIGHYATLVPTQNLSEVYETKYELLKKVRIGQAWGGEHGTGADKSTRSCIVDASRYCQEGVATVCVTDKQAGAQTWLRQHYCKGQGWRGYEAVMVRAGSVFMTGFSSDLVVDGQAREDVGEPSDLPTAEQVQADVERIKRALD